MTQTILVASASANTGSKVVEQLSASGKVNVKALVRKPETDGAKALAALPNVTLVKGDFEDPASLKEALKGVDRALLVSGAGDDQQYDREVAFIAAAAEANLEVTVRISTYITLISLETTGVYGRAHARIEKYIEEHKSRVIDLQPNWFISNVLWQAGEVKATGKISYPITPEQEATSKFKAIDTRDLAGAATAILLAPKDKVEELLKIRTLEVHGPEDTTFAEQLAAMSEAAGKKIELNHITPDAYSALLQSVGTSKVMADSFRDTVLVCVGAKAAYRQSIGETTPELLTIWQPKYTVKDWARDYAALLV